MKNLKCSFVRKSAYSKFNYNVLYIHFYLPTIHNYLDLCV